MMYLLIAIVLVVSVAAFAAQAQTSAEPADGFEGIWYEITSGSGDYPNKYGGGMATYPQQVGPIAVYRPEVNKTFFTFQLDPGDGQVRHAISYLDHQTGMVARPQVWLNKQTGDAHDASVLAIDADGYIYQFSMTHGENRRSYIRRSAAPYDIGSYVGLLSSGDAADMAVFGNPPQFPGAGTDGAPRFSYASAWFTPNAPTDDKFLLLHTRYFSGKHYLFTTTSADADTWTPRHTLAQIESGHYQTGWIKPDGHTVGTIFNVHPDGVSSPLDHRTDLYYLQTADQARTWQAADGSTLVDHTPGNAGDNPLTSRPGGAALVYDAAPDERVYLKDLNYDAQGNPVIMFLTSPTHTPGTIPGTIPGEISGDVGNDGQPGRSVRVAHWSGSDWNVSTVTTTDHNYDHGSLYVEQDAGGNEVWRIIAPYLDGPQAFGTGGEIGVWLSDDQGGTWSLVDQLTSGSDFNHSYARRPLNAHDDFYALWSDGDAFEKSDVGLYFADRSGNVYRLPTAFEPGQDEAKPELVRAVPEPASVALLGVGALATVSRRRSR